MNIIKSIKIILVLIISITFNIIFINCDDDDNNSSNEKFTINLPQMITDGLNANPSIYKEIPLRIKASGDSSDKIKSIVVNINENNYQANVTEDLTHWVAKIPIEKLENKKYKMIVSAETTNDKKSSVETSLNINDKGIQLTDLTKEGTAKTCSAHYINNQLWIMGADLSNGGKTAWIRQISGTGEWIGDKITIIGAEKDVVRIYPKIGNETIGILFQKPAKPYKNYFRIIDLQGNELVASIELKVNKDWYCSFHGTVLYKENEYIVVWREQNGVDSKIYIMSVNEKTGKTSESIMIAESGDDNPVGMMNLFTPLSAEIIDNVCVVGFYREYLDKTLGVKLFKGIYSSVNLTTKKVTEHYIKDPKKFFDHAETRVYKTNENEFIGIWTAIDVVKTEGSSDDRSIYYTKIDLEGNPDKSTTKEIYKAVAEVDSICFTKNLVSTATKGTFVWIDHSYYDTEGKTGKLNLAVAQFKNDNSLSDVLMLENTSLHSGLQSTYIESVNYNKIVLWLDSRNSPSPINPEFEIFMDTIWE